MGSSGSGDEHHHSSPKSLEEGRIKFLCSHGGKIVTKPDGHLRYVGGTTRLISLPRNMDYADLMMRIQKLFGPNLRLKYQLPNEDLDTLISVNCDDDVENLIEEYDRNEGRDGKPRLRAFLFPNAGLSSKSSITVHGMGESPKSSEPHAEYILPLKQQSKWHKDVVSDTFMVHDHACSVGSPRNATQFEKQLQNCHQYHREHPRLPFRHDIITDKASVGSPSWHNGSRTENARQQTVTSDTGDQDMNLTEPMLVALLPSNNHLWDLSNTCYEKGEHHIENNIMKPLGDKIPKMEVNTDADQMLCHKHAISENNMVKLQSRDGIFLEGSHGDVMSHVGAEHKKRAHLLYQAERHNLCDCAHVSLRVALPCTRHKAGCVRLNKPMEAHKNTQLVLAGVPGSQQNGGCPETAHRRIESYSAVEDAPYYQFNSPDAFKMQNGVDMDEQHLQICDYESAVRLKHEQHVHHLDNGHFQQVHWQLQDAPEIQQLGASQRQPKNYALVSSALDGHHHCIPASCVNERTMQSSDIMPKSRSAVRMLMQSGLGGVSRLGPQRLSRSPSPLRDHVTAKVAGISYIHGNQSLQMQNIGFMPPSRVHEASGSLGGEVFAGSSNARHLPLSHIIKS